MAVRSKTPYNSPLHICGIENVRGELNIIIHGPIFFSKSVAAGEVGRRPIGGMLYLYHVMNESKWNMKYSIE